MIEHVYRTRVAWVDTDAGGRIHFTAAFRWAEAAETELRRERGVLVGWGDYPRKRVEAEFHRVLVFEDEIDVHIRPERVGSTSITYVWEVRRGNEVCVEGRHTTVHVGDDGRPAELPEGVREALAG